MLFKSMKWICVKMKVVWLNVSGTLDLKCIEPRAIKCAEFKEAGCNTEEISRI
jgi:hypothetical protein